MTQDDLLSMLKQFGWSGEALQLGIQANFCCEYCDRDLLATVDDYDAWQVDHIVPSSRRGPNQVDNYALACKTCNFLKRHSLPSEHFDVSDRKQAVSVIREMVQARRTEKNERLVKIRELIRTSGLVPPLKDLTTGWSRSDVDKVCIVVPRRAAHPER